MNHRIYSVFNFDDAMPSEKLYEGRDSGKDETRQGDVEHVFQRHFELFCEIH